MGWSCGEYYLASLQKEKLNFDRRPPDCECPDDKTEDLSTDLLQLGHVGDVVVPPLSLLLLQLDGDASHGAALESLHQVSDEPGNLRLSLQNHATSIAFIRVSLPYEDFPIID